MRREPVKPDSIKYSLSNAAADTALERLAFMQGLRYFVERSFQGANRLGLFGTHLHPHPQKPDPNDVYSVVLFLCLAYIQTFNCLRGCRSDMRVSASHQVNRQIFQILRRAEGALIALLCLSLVLPTLWLSSLGREVGKSRLELSTGDLGIHLKAAIGERPGKQERSVKPITPVAQPPAAFAVPQLQKNLAEGLQPPNPAPWAVNFRRPFLPRPPPLS